MRLISKVGPRDKQVDYFGTKLIVPLYAKWLATDFDGICKYYDKKPTFNFHVLQWINYDIGEQGTPIANFYRDGIPPEVTLLEIK